MPLELFQKIKTIDGAYGYIVEVFEQGKAYLVDVKMDDGEYEQLTLSPGQIRSIIVESEQPWQLAH